MLLSARPPWSRHFGLETRLADAESNWLARFGAGRFCILTSGTANPSDIPRCLIGLSPTTYRSAASVEQALSYSQHQAMRETHLVGIDCSATSPPTTTHAQPHLRRLARRTHARSCRQGLFREVSAVHGYCRSHSRNSHLRARGIAC